MTVVDLFSGPGGWCTGAKTLGIDPLGIEIDSDACATREAAGLTTVQGDVMTTALTYVDKITGLIGSPPCPAFSQSGKQEAVSETPDLVRCLDNDAPDSAALMLPSETETGEMLSADALMCIEPFNWANAHRPEWVALEQVRAVLPIWEAGVRYLRRRGYWAWAGLLDAADYGVPQNRVRAVLIANRTRRVAPPPRSHEELPHPSLFGDEPEPWGSAWDGLAAWGITPDATHINTGRDFRIKGDRSSGQTIDMRERPSPTLTAKSGGQWHLHAGKDRDFGAKPRPADRPAMTLAFGKGAGQWHWTTTRPATTVQGDPRLWPPGHRVNADDRRRLGTDAANERYGDRAGTEAIRLTIGQALVLQGFPPDYPVQGSKTSQFKQVGNAVPPPLATHIIKAARGSDV